MQFHFISGLPRSGSTLLAAILRQNPRFSAHIESGLGRVFSAAHEFLGPKNEAHRFITDEQKRAVLRGLFSNFYAGSPARVVFDNNRRWTANIDLLADLFPTMKVIACVRSPVAIVDSLERLVRSHPLAVSVMHGASSNTSVGTRVNAYMGADGVVGYALDALRSAYYGPTRDRLLLVAYDDLARFPHMVMEHIHHALDEKPFAYRFDQISSLPGVKEFDEYLGTPGLHNLQSKVVYEPRQSILPPDIVRLLPKPFWIKETATSAS